MRTLDSALARELVDAQFPEWAHLPIQPVAAEGWDNRSFRLGDDMVVRLPSAACYVAQVGKEHQWLPVLAHSLTCPIPVPLALGTPGCGYPWPWSIYRWLAGEAVRPELVTRSTTFAADVAGFLAELQRADARDGPAPGPHNFHRGGPLSIYDAEVREALRRLAGKIDADAAARIWNESLATHWTRPPVWVHGDVSPGNLLLQDDRLCGVLDFGSLGVGDPACDLAIAWVVFRDDAREAFRAGVGLDSETWLRGRAWALWKGLVVAAGMAETNAVEWSDPLDVITHLLDEAE